MGNWNNSPKQSPSPCTWYRIGVENKDQNSKIQGLYRRVDFIDIPKLAHITKNDSDSKTRRQREEIMIENKDDYGNYYVSSKNVYARIYNEEYAEIDQKRQFIFLWNNGNEWIFSDYQSLHYYVDIKLGPQYVINPQTDNQNIAILSDEYSNDLDTVKMMKKIKYKTNMDNATTFKITISNAFSLNEENDAKQNIDDNKEALSSYSKQTENTIFRQSYIGWRENLNIFYQRSQLLTKQQMKEQEIKQENHEKANEVKRIIEEIDEIINSSKFKKLFIKYKDQSDKVNGWIHKDVFTTIINHETYNEFKKEHIDRKRDEQLIFVFVKGISLEFHKYFHGLFDELKDLNDPKEGHITFK